MSNYIDSNFNCLKGALESLDHSLSQLSENDQASSIAVERAAQEVLSNSQSKIYCSELSLCELVDFNLAYSRVSEKTSQIKEAGGLQNASNQAITSLDKIIKDVRAEAGLHYKTIKLEKLQSSPIEDVVDWFGDKQFLLMYASGLAHSSPDFLCDHLSQLPLTDRNHILQIGAILENANHQEIFSRHFKIPIKEIKEARFALTKTLYPSGTCLGNTLALISQKSDRPQQDEDTQRKARFIQSSYLLEIGNRFSRQDTIALGQTILANAPESEIYSTFLSEAAKFLGQEDSASLVEESKDPDKMNQNAYVVGKMAISICNELYNLAYNAHEELDTYSPEVQIEVVKEFNAVQDLAAAARNAYIPQADSGLAPDLIMKTLNLHQPEVVLKDIPTNQFSRQLDLFKNESGKFSLMLHSGKVDEDHAIYLSFNPPSYGDINDAELLKPVARTEFSSSEEMLEHLRKHIALTYFSDSYSLFDLYQYNPIIK